MKALIVFAHPNPNSYNAAVLETVKKALEQQKVSYEIKDLYRMNWNPLLSTEDLQKIYQGQVPADIAGEQEAVRQADTLVFIYPIWWFEQPAILKGWIDRVLSHGFAYRQTEQGMVEGLLKGKSAIVITTSGADEENMRKNGILDAINTCMVNGTLKFCGFEKVDYKNLFAVPAVSDDRRKQMLQEVSKMVADHIAMKMADRV
ncbi:NAD(P)H-dependent oxidoreductase [Thermincola potens]|uniref:NAD(P)H dehydrogenase (Quinone) n=1 Tax=Thermincola potens (strain JR) TaxID=635013 RepID=D5XEQ9_THEPJ|nr:NAD(P)H-dependent oxidoreductase [Thermincola potens]ADG82130.1 NAD(P)H dehydrogenase (quinone) [Thermincola potens JR]